jgi:osmotically-inducible protein OsmY
LKQITLTIVISFLILSYSTIFADTGTLSSSITNTSSGDGTNNNTNKTTQSTTYSTTTSISSNSHDDDIVSSIYAKYAKDPALIGTTLTVSSQNGIVSVTGTVTAQSQADEASIAAKSIAGVKDVRSTIKVTTNPNLNQQAKTPNY